MVCLSFAASVYGASDPLAGTKWKLNSAEGKATLTFEKGRFGIKACNSIGGNYQIKGRRIVSTGPPVSTMMACMGDLQKLDESLQAALTGNKSFKIDGDRLTLAGKDKKTWAFNKEPVPSANAVTKFIYVASEMKDCTGVAPMKCLQIREKESDPWQLHYGQIIGFDFVPGVEYRLRIKEDKVARPAADQSSLVWYLDLVVEQKVIRR